MPRSEFGEKKEGREEKEEGRMSKEGEEEEEGFLSFDLLEGVEGRTTKTVRRKKWQRPNTALLAGLFFIASGVFFVIFPSRTIDSVVYVEKRVEESEHVASSTKVGEYEYVDSLTLEGEYESGEDIEYEYEKESPLDDTTTSDVKSMILTSEMSRARSRADDMVKDRTNALLGTSHPPIGNLTVNMTCIDEGDGKKRPTSVLSKTSTQADARNARAAQWKKYKRLRSACDWTNFRRRGAATQSRKTSTAKHATSNKGYFLQNFQSFDTVETTCHMKDDEDADVTWTFAQIGPFYGRGHSDWNSIGRTWKDVGGLLRDGLWKKKKTKGKNASSSAKAGVDRHELERDVYILGGLIAPMDLTGDFVPYPPLHIHHAHVYPDDPMEMARHMMDSGFVSQESMYAYGDSHHIIIQAHGDSHCLEDEGGESCILHMAPEGLGHRISRTKDGLVVDFDVNDVRATDDPLRFYVEVAVAWTFESKRESTMFSFGNPVCSCSSHGAPGTYRYFKFLDAWMYYELTPPTELPDGQFDTSSLITHAHQNQLETLWILSGRGAYALLERVRRSLPLRLDLGTNSEKWPKSWNYRNRSVFSYPNAVHVIDLETLKQYIRNEIEKSHAEKESDEFVVFECEASHNLVCDHYDRQASMYCRSDVLRVGKDAPLVVVAFNRRVKPTAKDATTYDPFCGLHSVANSQHTIIRGYYVVTEDEEEEDDSNRKEKKNANALPPSLYMYTKWPNEDLFCPL
eukprot:g4189.t1